MLAFPPNEASRGELPCRVKQHSLGQGDSRGLTSIGVLPAPVPAATLRLCKCLLSPASQSLGEDCTFQGTWTSVSLNLQSGDEQRPVMTLSGRMGEEGRSHCRSTGQPLSDSPGCDDRDLVSRGELHQKTYCLDPRLKCLPFVVVQ